MIKIIYNLEPTYEVHEDCGVCLVWLKLNGKKYKGIAELSPEDKDFFSEKVGLNIALSRARIKILKALRDDYAAQAYQKRIMYNECIGINNPKDIDPTGRFTESVKRTERLLKEVREGLRKERKFLNNYLENQDKMVERIKIYRSRGKNE